MFSLDMPEDNKEKATSNTFPDYIAYIWMIPCSVVYQCTGDGQKLNMDRVKRIWYLPPMRAAKVQASLRIRAVSPEPPLLAHKSGESRGTFRQKARSLAPLNGWAWAVKICHDGMLEDTNSLGAAHIIVVILRCLHWRQFILRFFVKLTNSYHYENYNRWNQLELSNGIFTRKGWYQSVGYPTHLFFVFFVFFSNTGIFLTLDLCKFLIVYTVK